MKVARSLGGKKIFGTRAKPSIATAKTAATTKMPAHGQRSKLAVARGMTVVYVSHFWHDVSRMADAAELVGADLAKSCHDAVFSLEVLKSVNLSVGEGEQIALMGASGSGKSTLLHILGGLDLPSAGHVTVDGIRLDSLNATALGRLRNRALGFVYQFHHLLPEFTALENVAMPLLMRGQAPREASTTAQDMLGRVGLADRASHKPGEMSGGERQRAAVARALVTRPRCVLADEPTGNLDRAAAVEVMQLLGRMNEDGQTVILVTHDPYLDYVRDANALADSVQVGFVAPVLVVQKGTLVEFPNSDPIAHHVYSFSQPNDFQLPLYKGDVHEPIAFDHPGLVTLGCNIHDQMLAYILIVDGPVFGMTNEAGQVTLDSPASAGATVSIWSPRIRPRGETLTLDASNAEVVFQLQGRLRPPHDSERGGVEWSDY